MPTPHHGRVWRCVPECCSGARARRERRCHWYGGRREAPGACHAKASSTPSNVGTQVYPSECRSCSTLFADRPCSEVPSLNNSPLGTPELYTKLFETLNSHVSSGELLCVQPRSRSTSFFEIRGHTPCHCGTMSAPLWLLLYVCPLLLYYYVVRSMLRTHLKRSKMCPAAVRRS